MQVTITSSGVQALCAVLALLSGAFLWLIRTIVRSENRNQLKDINGTYVRSQGSKITGHEIETRLGSAEVEISTLRRKVVGL